MKNTFVVIIGLIIAAVVVPFSVIHLVQTQRYSPGKESVKEIHYKDHTILIIYDKGQVCGIIHDATFCDKTL